jgi:hypothetical protein
MVLTHRAWVGVEWAAGGAVEVEVEVEGKGGGVAEGESISAAEGVDSDERGSEPSVVDACARTPPFRISHTTATSNAASERTA